MGYTKTIALEEANKTGAILYELKTTEKVDGTLGFWWCGRFGMHRWGMSLEQIDIDFSPFDEVTICSPIWGFSISAPIRSFCKLKHSNFRSIQCKTGKFKEL